jgi:NitT/TauT family transport system substrate-binding protein
LHKQAAAANVTIGWIQYGDYGLDAYGPGFATTEETIAKRPDLVRKFLKATYRGYEYAKANPDKAADLMLKVYPTVDRTVALEQINDINDLITDKSAPDKRLGYIRDDRMRATVDFVDKAYGLNGKVKPSDIYTNDLLN